MNNSYEVGVTPDDNNNTRLPGSVQPEPQRGDSSYHHLEMAKAGQLDVKNTGGVIGMPSVGGDYVATPQKSASVTGPTGLVETTASTENLSAKYKYPRVSQDVPEKGRNQFSDHS